MRFFYTLLLAVLALPLHSADREIIVQPRGDAIITETREVAARGKDQLIWAPVSPRLNVDTVSLTGKGVPKLQTMSFHNDLDNRDKLLNRYLNKTILFKGKPVTLLRVEGGKPSVIREKNGQVKLNPGGDVALPDEDQDILAQPSLAWRVADPSWRKQEMTLRYLAGGVNWQASHTIELNADLSGATIDTWLKVKNDCGMPLDDTVWRFAEGDRMLAVPNAPATQSLRAGEETRWQLATGIRVGIAKEYQYDPVPGQHRPTHTKKEPARTIGILEPTTQTLPGGKATLMRVGKNGTASVMGTPNVGGSGPDRSMVIELPRANHLKGERHQGVFEPVKGKQAQAQQITVKLTNESDKAATVQVIEHPWGEWSIPEKSHDYEGGGDRIVFAVNVPAKGEATLKYTLQIAY